MERDWAADEWHVMELVAAGLQPIADKWMAALAERRRLAELLTWRHGPPTEPGLYVFTLSPNGLPYTEDLRPDDFTKSTRPWIKEIVKHLGPLPKPPSEEVNKDAN